MHVIKETPMEVSQHNETTIENCRKVKVVEMLKIFNTTGSDKDYNNDNYDKNPYIFNVNKLKKNVTVNLSLECNIKVVINRMTKHMSAYPETTGGFDVRFDKQNFGFVIKLCKKEAKDTIKIDGLYYKIYTYDFVDEKNIKKGSKKELYNKMMNKCA